MTATALTSQNSAVETPSGKGAADENFPVGSFLIPAKLRPCVFAFYAFARGADDIADNPDLHADDKIARLDAFEAGLDDQGPVSAARRLGDTLARCGVSDRHARDLLVAFRQDAVKHRYATLQELLDYCGVSANPVGRFLMDLHGEDPANHHPSDALCTALQILNHIQDVRDDLVTMDRCYVPQDWLSDAGASVDDLARDTASPGVRGVLDQLLDECDAMVQTAGTRAAPMQSRRLNAEMVTITSLARRLTTRLRHADPIATRVKLTRVDFIAATLAGLGGLVRGTG